MQPFYIRMNRRIPFVLILATLVFVLLLALPLFHGSAGPVRNDSLDGQISALERDVALAKGPAEKQAAVEKLDVVLAERERLLEALKEPPATRNQDLQKAAQLEQMIRERQANHEPLYPDQRQTLTGMIVTAPPPGGGARFIGRTVWMGPIRSDGGRLRVYAGILTVSGKPAVRLYDESPVGRFPMQFVVEIELDERGNADIVGESEPGVLELLMEDGTVELFNTTTREVIS